ncbi:histidine kinase dimerization/phosphoacceptor domain -containing protein [Nitrospirillum sp. BR 11163]|uniref:histidine kinase dimerization/phosphoacceptor domain -containing protein n=1 Tax=Nitrospirillum sp. BR 11163 TaxID=3104323 RepID=UPI002AFEA231|nr:cache domain-containing protein [Nitrospirillum sp. BR 11163]MEA1672854.1 histidine kinase dimerization/phosphoacceptor domain -containing protein [Nitrospirillum sp. BR 11163]
MSLTSCLLILAAVAALPAITAEIYNETALRHARTDEARLGVSRQADLVATDLAAIFDGGRQVLAMLTSLPQVQDHDIVDCGAMARQAMRVHAGYDNIVVADLTGQVWCSGLEGSAGRLLNVADRSYFNQAIKTGRFSVGELVTGRVTGKPSVQLALPYAGRDGNLVGVMLISLNADWLARHFSATGEWTTDHTLTLADRTGTVVVRLPGNEKFRGTSAKSSIEEIQWSNQRGVLETTKTMDGVPRLVGYVPSTLGPEGFYIGVAEGRDAIYAALNRATLRSSLINGLGFAAAMLVAWLMGTHLVRRPIDTLAAAAKAWRAGNLSTRARVVGRGEFAGLATVFNEMAEHLEQAIARKDMLHSELSHRMMNNLQILGTLIDRPARTLTDTDARQTLTEAAGRVRSMAMAYQRLHRSPDGTTVNVADFLHAQCRDLADAMMVTPERMELDVAPILLPVGQAMPLALAANEMLTNALKHGQANGGIKVTLKAEGCRCTLTVANAGSLPTGTMGKGAGGFGLRLLQAIAGQLAGELRSEGAGESVAFVLSFPVEGDVAFTAYTGRAETIPGPGVIEDETSLGGSPTPAST